MIPKYSKIFQNNKNNTICNHECKFCFKIYSQCYNLNKHLKSCKIKKTKRTRERRNF
jgi:hypothetical protein